MREGPPRRRALLPGQLGSLTRATLSINRIAARQATPVPPPDRRHRPPPPPSLPILACSPWLNTDPRLAPDRTGLYWEAKQPGGRARPASAGAPSNQHRLGATVAGGEHGA